MSNLTIDTIKDLLFHYRLCSYWDDSHDSSAPLQYVVVHPAVEPQVTKWFVDNYKKVADLIKKLLIKEFNLDDKDIIIKSAPTSTMHTGPYIVFCIDAFPKDNFQGTFVEIRYQDDFRGAFDEVRSLYSYWIASKDYKNIERFNNTMLKYSLKGKYSSIQVAAIEALEERFDFENLGKHLLSKNEQERQAASKLISLLKDEKQTQ